MMSLFRFGIMALVAVVLTTGLVACGSSGGDSANQTQAFEADVLVTTDDEGTKVFQPSEVEVTGDHGQLVVENELDAEHGFTIPEFGIEAVVPPNSTETYQIDQASPGEYAIKCQLHAAHQEGLLRVQAPESGGDSSY